ncbi:sugar phosphate isomerase/epimerase family protein [Lacrimispora brassicae]
MISVTAWCLLGTPRQHWPRLLKLIHNCGFEGIEMHVDNGQWPIPPEINRNELEWLFEALSEAELSVTGFSTMIHSNDSIISDDKASRNRAIHAVDKMIDLAAMLGGKHVTIIPGGIHEDWKKAIAVIQELNAKAKSKGILFLIENVWYSFSYDLNKLADLINAVGPNVGICFDIGNALPYGNTAEWLLRFKDKLEKIHISDAAATTPHQIYPVGQGSADWSKIADVLKSIHYTKDLTLELFPSWERSLVLELSRTGRFLKRIFNDLEG